MVLGSTQKDLLVFMTVYISMFIIYKIINYRITTDN